MKKEKEKEPDKKKKENERILPWARNRKGFSLAGFSFSKSGKLYMEQPVLVVK